MKKVISVILIILMLGTTVSTSAYASGSGLSPYYPIQICGVCGKEANLYQDSSVYPTCQKEGYIKLSCHSYTVPKRECMVIDTEWDATCTEPGKKWRHCMLGCDLWDEITIIPPKGHELESNRDGKNPTCTESGYTSTHSCNNKNCDLVIEKEILPPLGHTPIIDKAVAPTCSETGLTEGSHCGVCDEVIVKQEVVPVKHIKSTYWLITKKPTETEIGEKVKYCISCDKVLKTKTITSVCKHKSVTDKSVKPTCSKVGLTKGSHCTKCNCIIVKQKKIAKTEHKEVLTSNVSSTCTEFGYRGGTHCSVCNVIITPPTITELKPHKRVCDKYKEVTCTENGLTVGYHCGVCNATILKQLEIPALKHDKVLIGGKEATCSEAGLTTSEYCSICNEVFKKQEIIPKKPHDLIETVLEEATCEKEGRVNYTCTNCDYSEIKKISGHSAKTVEKKSATYFAKGHTGKEVCKDCSEVISKGKAIPKLKLKTPKATVKVKKKKIIVKYQKVKDAKGFEVKYKYKGKTIKKSYTTNKAKTIAFKNLKKGKYEFYIRAFTKQGNKKAYSNWTQVKKVRAK